MSEQPSKDPLVNAQHDETGRWWSGPRSQIPPRYYEVTVAPPSSNELRSLLEDVREYLDRFKDYRLIVGPPHKNDAWELMDRIDAMLPRVTVETLDEFRS